MANRFVVNKAALGNYFRTDPVPQAALKVTAETLKSAAVEKSPTGKSLPWGRFNTTHGWFKKAYHLRRHRGGYRLYNRDPFAHLVEYGSVNNPVYSPIRRAARSMPGKFVDPGPSSAAQDKFDEL